MDDAEITSAVRSKMAAQLRSRMELTPALDTQVKLATAAGIAQASVQRILSCNQSATIDVLYKLAVAFGDAGPAHFMLTAKERELLDLMSGLKDSEVSRVIGVVREIVQLGRDHNPAPADIKTITSNMPPGMLVPAVRQSSASFGAAAEPTNAVTKQSDPGADRLSA